MHGSLKAASLALLLASTAAASAQRYMFKQYGQEQGLESPDVVSIAQDRAGFLWLGTQNGIYRYDGSRFQLYGLQQGLTELTIRALHIDSQDRLWAGAESGVFYLERGNFHELRAAGRSLEMGAGLESFASGEVLISTSRHVLYSAQRRATGWAAQPFSAGHKGFPEKLEVFGLLADGNDRLWMGCGREICEYELGQMRHYGVSAGVPADTYEALVRDASGGLWVRGRSHMLLLPSAGARFLSRPVACEMEPCDAAVAPFARDRAGRLLAPWRNGVARWNGVRWEMTGRAQGLPDAAVSHVFVDHEGMVWIAELGFGLWRWLGYDEWEHWDLGQGLKDPVIFGIEQDDQGRIWTASQGEVLRSDRRRRTFQRFVPATGPPMRNVLSMVTAFDRTMWLFGSYGEVWHLWPDSGRVEKTRLPTGNYQALADSRNRVWACTGRGLFVEEKVGQRWQMHEEGAAFFHDRVIRAIAEDPDHSIWVGSIDGLFHSVSGEWKKVQMQGASLGKYIRNVAVSRDGTLWISGQFQGVARLRIRNDRVTSAELVKNSATHSALVLSVMIDDRDRVLVGTDHGLDLLESGSWRHYDTAEGMLSNDTNEKAVFADADGSFWIGSTGGLSHLTLPAQPAPLRPITTTLTEASWAGMPLPLDRQEQLAWRSGDLTVRFAVLSFRNQDAICFRYRLLGLEDEWVSTRDHSVRYAKLPPGKYRFEVVSEDSGLHQTSQPASFSFEVLPPLWRTWYFFAVCALLLGGLVVAIWRLRVHQLVATQAKLERTVRDRTRALEEERVLLLVARDALKQQVTHDSLTGLWNRRAISDALSREWQRACREHLNLLVVVADLDDFKSINDTHGHPGGDEVLVQAAQCLQANIREYDALGRYGGEEFMLVLTEGEWEDWSARVNRIRESIARERFLVAGKTIKVTCSFGAAGFTQRQEPIPLNELLAAGDRALYRAKANGRNRVEFAEAPRASTVRADDVFHIQPS